MNNKFYLQKLKEREKEIT